MSLSSRVEEGNTSLRTGQPSCRFDTGPGKWRYLKAVMLLMALVPLLVGCVDGPLSTLQPASDVTRSVALLWWAMAIGTGVVLLLMVVLAGLALRNDPPRAPGKRGVRILLIAGGLVLPTSVIVALLVYALRLDEAQWPPVTRVEAAQAFHVDVIAHRWWWEVRYPGVPAGEEVPNVNPPVLPRNAMAFGDTPVTGEGVDTLRTINVLHVPAGVPIHVRIMASDVIHSFWVPRIAGKLDAVPGKVNRLRLMIDEPGEYAGVCAEFCGDGHTSMRFNVIAHSPEDLESALAALQNGSVSSRRESTPPQPVTEDQ